MHLLLDTALMAPVRGWLTRAERLLEGSADTPVHAWLAVVRNYERMFAGDGPARGSGLGVRSRWGCDVIPRRAPSGRVAEARLSRSLDGDVQHGLVLLDEAGVAATSGELDPLSTGLVYCELVCALQGVAQFDLAEEWTNVMERWCGANAIGSLRGRCRVHRAEILRLRGSFDDAEKEVLLACEELRPYLRRELGWPLTELGRIRRRQGDTAGAEEGAPRRRQRRVGSPTRPRARFVSPKATSATPAASVHTRRARAPSQVPSKERLTEHADRRRAAARSAGRDRDRGRRHRPSPIRHRRTPSR